MAVMETLPNVMKQEQTKDTVEGSKGEWALCGEGQATIL